MPTTSDDRLDILELAPACDFCGSKAATFGPPIWLWLDADIESAF